MSEVHDDNKALVRALFEQVINADRLEDAASLMREDYRQHSALVAPGLAGFQAFFRAVRQAFPDLRLTIADLIAEGDKVVARIVGEGTHRGEFLGVPATGRRVRSESIDIFRVEDGKLAEHWDVMDLHGLLTQLTAPEEAPPDGLAQS